MSYQTVAVVAYVPAGLNQDYIVLSPGYFASGGSVFPSSGTSYYPQAQYNQYAQGAEFLVVGKDSTHSSSRSVRAGTNITFADGGSGSVLTISATAAPSGLTFGAAMMLVAMGF